MALVGCEAPEVSGVDSRVQESEKTRDVYPTAGDGAVVKARARLNLVLGSNGEGKGEILAAYVDGQNPSEEISPEIEIFAGQASGTDVSVTLPVSTSYALDLSSFIASPTISNQVISFGNLGLANTFYDNNIKVCGSSQNGQCTLASIRAYTAPATGVTNAGNGLWNANGGYGVPLSIKDSAGVAQEILLGQSASKLLESFQITSGKRVLTYSDWQAFGGVIPSFAVSADFTLAGAGVYSATLILEYVLSQ